MQSIVLYFKTFTDIIKTKIEKIVVSYVFFTDLAFLQSLNLTKMVTCRLNPLKVCLPVVAQNFATVTRTYQLAYCYSVLQHNARYRMPVIHQDDKGYAVSKDCTLLDTFFPFDPFVLHRSVMIAILHVEFALYCPALYVIVLPLCFIL
jgi:hypothetical protein